MIQVNLLPDIKKQYLRSLRIKSMVVFGSFLAIAIAAGAIVALSMTVYIGQVQYMGFVDGQIEKSAEELRKKPTLNRDLTIQNQLSALPELHASKSKYSRIMDMLPTLNPASPNSVTLTTMQLQDETSTVSFNGRTGSFEALTSFRDSLRYADVTYVAGDADGTTTEKLFSSVVIETSALTQEQGNQFVAFSIRTVYNPGVFAESSRNVALSIPSIQTSSQADLSRKIFEEAQ